MSIDITDFPKRFLAIDEDGFVLNEETKVTDQSFGSEVLNNLTLSPTGALFSQLSNEPVVIEAFDQPLVALKISKPEDSSNNLRLWTAFFQYGVSYQFDLSSLSADEWDRFHGHVHNIHAEKQIPFVLSDDAQNQLFNMVDSFDDDSLTFEGNNFLLKDWLNPKNEVGESQYWTDVYQNEKPGWELERPAPALVEMLPRMKMAKSRVLVLGAGTCNDAAFFAEHGHIVTAVDFSSEAISRAQKKYGHLKNLKFVEKDIFKIDASWNESFDLVFEHTCFCAISPDRRDDLIKIWRRVLVPTGQLMGVFFATEKRFGPPYGGTEWELRERLEPYFQMTFWGRWRQSLDRRNGKELFVLAQKISL